MAADSSKRFDQLVGENVRHWRLERDMTQDDVLDELRVAGVNWVRSTVAKTEGGTRSVSPFELVALSFALRVGLQDLLARAKGMVSLRPGLDVKLDLLRRNIAKGQPAIQARDLELQRRMDAVQPVDEAERHVARLLDRPVADVQEAAKHLWGRRLRDEREQRLGAAVAGLDPDSRQAHRGHITRKLVAELRDHLGGTPKRGRKR